MRWYCVHPSLPLRAELRIRAAADRSSVARALLPHDRAIAAYDSVGQRPGTADDVASPSWLPVTFRNASSGETEDGYVMASLPDGMPLVVPWEQTDFRGCCEVVARETLMFDGPVAGAQCVGAVQCAAYLYGIVDESAARVRIVHPELDSVWVNKADVQIVCSRLTHDACSTRHAFYELHEDLPENAQIAIREFPSTVAQAVALLSRGDTVEVAVRGGNWLQISGGNLDRAWIMWRTDDLELLSESSDACSSNCQRLKKSFGGIVEAESATNLNPRVDNHTVTSDPNRTVRTTASTAMPAIEYEVDSALEIGNARDVVSGHNTIATDGFASMVVTTDTAERSQARPRPVSSDSDVTRDDDTSNTDALRPSTPTEGVTSSAIRSGSDVCVKDVEAAVVVVAGAFDDRPIRPARSTHEQMIAESDGGDVDSVVIAASTVDDIVYTEQAVSRRSMSDGSATSIDSDIGRELIGVSHTATSCEGVTSSAIRSGSDVCVKDVEAAVVVVAGAFDDRPIRPARSTHDQMIAESDGGDVDSVVIAASTVDDIVYTEQAVSRRSMSDGSATSIDSDIGRELIGVSHTATSCEGVTSSAIRSGSDVCVKDVEAAVVVVAGAFDDRPIRPARSTHEQMIAESDGGDVDSVVIAASTVDDIVDTEQAVSRRSMSDGSATSIDSDIGRELIGVSHTATSCEGVTSSAIRSGSDVCVKDVEAAVVVVAGAFDDRPIRPARSTHEQMIAESDGGDVDSVVIAASTVDDIVYTEQAVSRRSMSDGSATSIDSDIGRELIGVSHTATSCEGVTSSAIRSGSDVCVKDVEAAVVVVAGAFDDRPIRPARSTHEQMIAESDGGDVDSVVIAASTVDDIVYTEQAVSRRSMSDGSATSIDSDIGRELIGVSHTATSCEGVTSSAIRSGSDVCVKDVEAAVVVVAGAFDDRPIRPARSTHEQMIAESDGGDVDSVVIAASTVDDIVYTEQAVSRRSMSDGSATSIDSDIGRELIGVSHTATSCEGVTSSAIRSGSDVCVKDVEAAVVVVAGAFDDRPIRPARSTHEQMIAESDGGDVDSVVIAASTVDDIVYTEQAVSRRSMSDGSATSIDSDIGRELIGVSHTATSCEGVTSSAIRSGSDVCVKDVEAAVVVVAGAFDDRPIRPARSTHEQMIAESDGGDVDSVVIAASTVDDIVYTEQAVSRRSMSDGSATSIDSDIGRELIGVSHTATSCEGVTSSAIRSGSDVCVKDVEAAVVVVAGAFDDRPIRPARSTHEQMIAESDGGDVDSVVIAASTVDDIVYTEQAVSRRSMSDGSATSIDSDIGRELIGVSHTATSCEGVTSSAIRSGSDVCVKDVEAAVVVVAGAFDDRPIRPARSTHEQMIAESDGGDVDSVVIAASTVDDIVYTEQAVSRRSMSDGSATSIDSDIGRELIGVSHTATSCEGGTSSAIRSGSDVCVKDVEAAVVVVAGAFDDRPIRPARSTHEQMIAESDGGDVDSVVIAASTVDDIVDTEQAVSRRSMSDGSATSIDSDIGRISIGVSHTATSCEGVTSSAIRSGSDVCVKDVEAAVVVVAGAFDDRPIRPARSTHDQMIAESDGGDVDSVVIAASTVDDIVDTEQAVSRRSMSDGSATSIDSDIGRISIGRTEANAADASDEIESVVRAMCDVLASGDVVVPTRINSGDVAGKLIAPIGCVTDEDIADGSHSNDATYVAGKVEENTRMQNACVREYRLVSSSSAGGLFGGDIRTLRDRNDLLPLTCSSVFEGQFADLETSFGSENGEIALLGSSEDAFDPVDELLPTTYEGSSEWPENVGPDASPEAMTNDSLSSRCDAGVGARGDESVNGRPCYRMNKKVPDVGTVQADVISMLQAGGIIRYCEYKQTHITPADKLSLAVYEANEDDPDLVFQALVGDDPLSDDWFHDVSPSPSHSDAKKLDLCAGPKSTFDLIMNNASPEEILAAELSNEDCGDFDLVVAFRYPVPERRGRTSGRRHSSFTCVPTARARPSTESKTPDAVDENVIEGHDTPPSRQLGRVQQQIAMTSQDTTSTGTSVLPPTESSLSQPQPMLQTRQAASAVSCAHGVSGESIPRLKALASSASNMVPTARSFLQRRSFSVSTSSSSLRALGALGVTTNSVTSASKPAERSRLPLPQRSFGLRRPASGLTKRT